MMHRAVRPYVMDLGSTNGTFLNGERVESRRCVCVSACLPPPQRHHACSSPSCTNHTSAPSRLPAAGGTPECGRCSKLRNTRAGRHPLARAPRQGREGVEYIHVLIPPLSFSISVYGPLAAEASGEGVCRLAGGRAMQVLRAAGEGLRQVRQQHARVCAAERGLRGQVKESAREVLFGAELPPGRRRRLRLRLVG